MNWLDRPGRTVLVASAFIGVIVVLAIGLTLGLEWGEQEFPPGTPERAFQDYLQTYDDRDYAAVYQMFSTEVREDVTQEEYVDEARRHNFYPSNQDQRVRIDRTSVEGDRATLHLAVEYSYGGGFGNDSYVNERQIPMVREDEAWKIDTPLLGLDQAWNLTIPTSESSSQGDATSDQLTGRS
jgi:hypothetical protein